MTNLAMTKEEAKAEYGMSTNKAEDDEDLPRYPYGLTLYLDDDTLEKLGITDLPKVGSKMLAQITVMVTGTSQRATQSTKAGEEMKTCVDMQITDMELAMPAGKPTSEVMYPSK